MNADFLKGISVGLIGSYLFYRLSQSSGNTSAKNADESRPVYLDYNATTPIDQAVGDAMVPFFREFWGNPSCSHIFGRQAGVGVVTARKQVANLLRVTAEEIILCSGGTETINHALKGGCFYHRKMDPKRKHIIVSCVEHIAVTATAQWLESQGFELTILPVDKYGQVLPESLKAALKKGETAVVSIMHANNEVGTINDIAELVRVTKDVDPAIYFHTDCSQSAGKVSTNLAEMNVDLATIAGHKIYGPKGAGALYKKKGVVLDKFMHGAGHESGERAGTENVILYAGLGKACELVKEHLESEPGSLRKKRNRLLSLIKEKLQGLVEFQINGHPEKSLPNTLSISFKHVDATKLLHHVEDKLACSAGAACHSHEVTLSHVLKGMGVDPVFGLGTVRLSVGYPTTDQELVRAAEAISAGVLYFQSKAV